MLRKFVKTLKPNFKKIHTHTLHGHSHYENDITFTEKIGMDILNDPLLNAGKNSSILHKELLFLYQIEID